MHPWPGCQSSTTTATPASRKAFPASDFKVIPGDCNTTIDSALRELQRLGASWAPTFAFVDPNGPDIRWSTLEALSRFKPTRSNTKTEIWMLLADGMFMRMLPTDGQPTPATTERINALYGTDRWQATYEAKRNDEITPTEAREEYVNLMRWRLEKTSATAGPMLCRS